MCVCVCVCALWPNWFCGGPGGLRWKKKPAKSAFVPTGPLSDHHTHTHTALNGRVPCCLHTLWLRCHLSQARCGWAGSCVCGCFALGLSSRIFIINEVTDYTFQISSCSMCWADVVSLSVFPLWYIFIDIYSTTYCLSHITKQHMCSVPGHFIFPSHAVFWYMKVLVSVEKEAQMLLSERGKGLCMCQLNPVKVSVDPLSVPPLFWLVQGFEKKKKSPYEFLAVKYCIQLTTSFETLVCKYLHRAINYYKGTIEIQNIRVLISIFVLFLRKNTIFSTFF